MRATRRSRPELPVGVGERLLAWSADADGRAVGGTRDALYLPSADGVVRLPWEQVEAADWDAEESLLTVQEVGRWGEVRPVHRVTVDATGRLLQLVRERVTASVVLQRHVPVQGLHGVRIIARRAPSGDRPITWLYEYDDGVDPNDPAVREAAKAALARAQEEIGAS